MDGKRSTLEDTTHRYDDALLYVCGRDSRP